MCTYVWSRVMEFSYVYILLVEGDGFSYVYIYLVYTEGFSYVYIFLV